MSQAGAALAWQRWLEQRYARATVEARGLASGPHGDCFQIGLDRIPLTGRALITQRYRNREITNAEYAAQLDAFEATGVVPA